MPTKRDVSYIKSRLLKPALTSHFEVEIGFPAGNEFIEFLRDNGILWSPSKEQPQLNLLCSEATLPGSNLATLDINNDFTGVTERHAYRRIYDDRIDLTFYVNAEDYLPIRFFETWIKYIVDESIEDQNDKGVGSEASNYFYRVRYPDADGYPAYGGYTSTGLKVIKFERDYNQKLEYKFVKAYPISITSMPISYDSSSLLKCTVSMTYIRYVLLPQSGRTNSNSSNQTTTNPNFNLTAEQLAAINSSQAFGNPNLRNLNFGDFTTTGGVNFNAAQSSGNSINIQDAYSGNFTLNG
jgi:hypothetical protein